MSDEMACTGTLIGLRHMKGTGALRVEIEIPKEMSNEAHRRLGGYPDPASSRWVALAVLKENQ